MKNIIQRHHFVNLNYYENYYYIFQKQMFN